MMKIFSLVAVIVSLMGGLGIAHGQSKVSDKEIFKAAEKAVQNRLKDPDSAKFRKLVRHSKNRLGRETDYVCGEVNAKNSMGGYNGFQGFAYELEIDEAYFSNVTSSQNRQSSRLEGIKNTACLGSAIAKGTDNDTASCGTDLAGHNDCGDGGQLAAITAKEPF